MHVISPCMHRVMLIGVLMESDMKSNLEKGLQYWIRKGLMVKNIKKISVEKNHSMKRRRGI